MEMINLSKVKVIYSSADDLPSVISEKINADVLTAFVAGKESFFIGIKESFPDIYSYLIRSASDLYLVDADGEGRVFYWCLGTEKTTFSRLYLKR